MFDLQAGVHLHEPDAVCAQAFGRVRDELDRTCTDIVHCLGRADGGGAEHLTGFAASIPGAGASSITFWWRRCSEQSRSNK